MLDLDWNGVKKLSPSLRVFVRPSAVVTDLARVGPCWRAPLQIYGGALRASRGALGALSLSLSGGGYVSTFGIMTRI